MLGCAHPENTARAPIVAPFLDPGAAIWHF
jgi:hypothetical protein